MTNDLVHLTLRLRRPFPTTLSPSPKRPRRTRSHSDLCPDLTWVTTPTSVPSPPVSKHRRPERGETLGDFGTISLIYLYRSAPNPPVLTSVGLPVNPRSLTHPFSVTDSREPLQSGLRPFPLDPCRSNCNASGGCWAGRRGRGFSHRSHRLFVTPQVSGGGGVDL